MKTNARTRVGKSNMSPYTDGLRIGSVLILLVAMALASACNTAVRAVIAVVNRSEGRMTVLITA